MSSVTGTSGARATCESCGGNVAWAADAGRLRCDYCGHLQAPRENLEHPQGGRIVEHDLAAALRGGMGKARWVLADSARQVRCTECGAQVEFPDGVTATRCAFCDSPSVLVEPARNDLLAPESVIPFAVTRDAAVASFRGWLKKLWLRPSDLRHKADVSELRGVYVPYWTFDAGVTSRWTADAGYYYWDTESYTTTENGKSVRRTRQVRKVRWEPASGSRHDHHDEHLVCASRGLPADLVRELCNFQTSALLPYAPEFLQGFSAESYAVDLANGWHVAQEELAALQLARCARDVPGDTQRNLRANHEFQEPTFKHALLPVWVAAFRYREKVFRFLVNGQTGKVAGHAPYSWLKIALLVILCVAIAGLVAWLWLNHAR